MSIPNATSTSTTRRVRLPRTIAAMLLVGALGLAGCASNSPESVPSTKTLTPTAPEESSPKAEPSPSAAPVSTVPKIRDNWIVNEDALVRLYKVSKRIQTGDLDLVRADVCNEFFAHNLLDASFATQWQRENGLDFNVARRLEGYEEVEARFEARQRLLLDFVSDRYRADQWREDISTAELLGGVSVCVNNGVQVTGSVPQEWMTAVIDDKPLPSVTTEPMSYRFNKGDTGSYDRTSYVAVTVGVNAPVIVWRRHLWSDISQDWYVVNEQAKNPYDFGWSQ